MAKRLKATAQGVEIIGVKQTQLAMRQLGLDGSRRAARSALSASLGIVTRAIKKETVLRTRPHTGKLVNAAAHRQKKNKFKGIFEAKSGFNVGKKNGAAAPHAHLIALGTKIRTTKSGANRGMVEARHIVDTAYHNSAQKAKYKMQEQILKRIHIETARARRAGK